MTEPFPEVSVRAALDRNEVLADAGDEGIFSTDTGNGRRFVRLFGDVVRYARDADRWYTWNGRIWEPDCARSLTVFALTTQVVAELRAAALELSDEPAPGERRSPREHMLAWAQVSEGIGHRRRMLEEAMAHPRLQLTEPDLDAAGDDLMVTNGVVNLITGELRAGRPADLASRTCTADYIPEAAVPGYSAELELFFETFLPDPLDQKFVWAVLGRALLAGNRTRTFPIIWGGTTSGKSQLMAAVHQVLGTYACVIGSSVFRGNLDDKPRPDLVQAMYARLAYATEASKSWALHGDQIKRLTGGDSLPYRNLYHGTLNAYPRFTPVLVTNEMPRVPGADAALRRRILVIHFDRTLEATDEDPAVKARFLRDPRCRRAVLAKLVQGARDPIAGSVSEIPPRYALATMNALGGLDHVEEFLSWLREMDLLVAAPDDVPVSSLAKVSELYDWYKLWTTRYGDRVDRDDALSMRAFNQKLRDDHKWTSRVSAGVRWVGWTLRGDARFVPLSGL